MPLASPSSYVSTTSEFVAHWESADAALGAAGPIVVGGGVTLADFKALRESLIAQRDQVIADLNEVELDALRAVYNTWTRAGAVLRLTPKPGHTPPPVAAHASWDTDSARGKITWEASEEATLKEYQVRGCPGDKYETDDEHVVAHAAPDVPHEVLTTFGLAQPGSTASYRVYVILDTGNEKGSETVSVERPAPDANLGSGP